MSTSTLAAGCTTSSSRRIVAPSLDITASPDYAMLESRQIELELNVRVKWTCTLSIIWSST